MLNSDFLKKISDEHSLHPMKKIVFGEEYSYQFSTCVTQLATIPKIIYGVKLDSKDSPHPTYIFILIDVSLFYSIIDLLSRENMLEYFAHAKIKNRSLWT